MGTEAKTVVVCRGRGFTAREAADLLGITKGSVRDSDPEKIYHRILAVLSGEVPQKAPSACRSDHELYNTWMNIKQRCLNPNAENYKHYGGRGITICQEWQESFESFLADVGDRPFAGATLDRIDNSDGYRPGNVRWANIFEQRENTRRSRIIVHDGKSLSIAKWARLLGVSRSSIHERIERGMTGAEAVSVPFKRPASQKAS